MPDLEVELVLDAGAELGEGPCWDSRAQLLLWVDITAGIVHRLDPARGSDEAFDVGQPVGAAVPSESGQIALAVSDGFSLLDVRTGRVEPIADVDRDVSGTMMNDGKCDPAGRFWGGTRDVEGRQPIGSLYRLDADHRVTRVLSGVTLSNGLDWSPDRRTMYYIDSTTHGIDAFDFEISTGALSGRRRLVELPREWGLPDGMTVDEEECLWVAFWGASSLRRFESDGEVVTVIDLPVSRVTSCAFGGDDLDDLYVTSACGGLSPQELREQPHAGGLFRLSPGVRGLPSHPFAG
jgi:sugar lactone lactonase YvrE